MQLEASSYRDIALTLGVDQPASILFATDSLTEAEAANKAGWTVALTTRPGNVPLPDSASFRHRVITSMTDLLDC